MKISKNKVAALIQNLEDKIATNSTSGAVIGSKKRGEADINKEEHTKMLKQDENNQIFEDKGKQEVEKGSRRRLKGTQKYCREDNAWGTGNKLYATKIELEANCAGHTGSGRRML